MKGIIQALILHRLSHVYHSNFKLSLLQSKFVHYLFSLDFIILIKMYMLLFTAVQQRFYYHWVCG